MKTRIALFLLLSLLSLQSIRAFSSIPSTRLTKYHSHYIQHSSLSRLYDASSSTPEDSPNKPPPGTFDFSSFSTSGNAASHSLLKNTDSNNTVPSYKSIIVFVSTTILIWLSEPLLSLVDTTIVGRQSHHFSLALVQLAALGPATMLIDSLVYLTYFLSIATTCQMAHALAKHDWNKMISTASQIMGIAGILGGMITAIMFGFGKPLLTWCAGEAGNPTLILAALQYSKIRCSVSILSIMGMVSQSICLAVQDTKTPAMAVLVASLVNIVGDVMLIPKFGLKGAAIATAAASVASALVLLKSIRNKTLEWNKNANDETSVNGEGVVNGSKMNGINGYGNNTTSVIASTTIVDGKPVLNATRAALIDGRNGTMTVAALRASLSPNNKDSNSVPFISLPDGRSTFELIKLAGPIFFVIMGKILCYSSLTLKATNFGVLQVATHNIMMRIFFFHAVFGDSLTQAAQTYLPSTLLQKSNSKVKQLLKKLMILATGIGVFNYVSIKSVLRMGHLFTSNTEIVANMAKHTSSISFAALLHSYIMVLEGAIIASGDLKYLVATYVATMGVLFAQLKYATRHFAGVWVALLLFQVLRLVQFKSRVVHKVLLQPKAEASVVQQQ